MLNGEKHGHGQSLICMISCLKCILKLWSGKYKRTLCLSVCVFIILLFIIPIESFAMNTGFSTQAYNKTIKTSFEFLKKEPPQKPIECFSVSEDNKIAIGASSNENRYVSIYDENGNYLYGYSFNDEGTFGVEWEQSELLIILVRCGLIVKINHKGNIVRIDQIENTVDNSIYLHNNVFAKSKIVNGNKYELNNDMGILNIFASKYSTLAKTNLDGVQTVIYDVHNDYLIILLVSIIGVVLFITIAITVLIVKTRNVGHNTN